MHPQAAKRAELVFALFDADGNGVIEVDDFELMTDRVVASAAASDDAAKAAIREAFAAYWRTLSAELDVDGDGQITREEFSGFVLSPERFGPTVQQFAQALAALGDPDGDGLIERPVFLALMLAIGFGEQNINALFDEFGPNGDGLITVDTWVAGIKDFYAPDLAGIAGDYLVPGSVPFADRAAG